MIAPVGQAVMQRVHVPQRAGCGCVRFKRKRRQDLAKEEPGAELRVDEHRALAVPADAGLRRVIALEDRTRIDIALLDAAARREERVELAQLREHDIVVIIAPRVTRDAPVCVAGSTAPCQ